jgi:hypothetical protein
MAPPVIDPSAFPKPSTAANPAGEVRRVPDMAL